MKRKIIVTINADEKTCGKCDWRCMRFCHLFEKRITTNRYGGDKRIAACLAAESKAKEVGK